MVTEEERGSYSIISVGVIIGDYRKKMAQIRDARRKSKKIHCHLQNYRYVAGGGQLDVLL